MNLLNRTYRNIGWFLIVSFFSVGCADQLNETNPNAKPVEDYFKNLTESDKVLTAAYSSLLNHYNLNIVQEAWRTDEGYPSHSQGRPQFYKQGEPWYFKTFTNSQVEINKKWDALYKGVFRANQLIEGLNGPLADQNEDPNWISQMAQARMLRGIFHFYLYQSFNNGRVIIRDKVPVTLEDFNIPVSSKAEVRAFILEDFEYAYENLPGRLANEAEQELAAGRMNKGIAAMFLGNLYLLESPAHIDGDEFNPDYDMAKKYYEELIFSGEYPYQLEQDASIFFTRAGQFNKESIFEIVYDDNLKPEMDRWDEQSPSNRWARFTAPGSQGGQRILTPNAWLSYAYKTEVKDTKDVRNFVFDVDEEGNDILVEREVSLRASAMISLVNDINTPYYRSLMTPEAVTFGKYEFAYFKKYTNHDIITSENNLPKGAYYSGKNVCVNRLSEAYLNLAECYLATGNTSRAIELINTIRKRWGLQLIGPSNGDTAHDYDEKTYTSEDVWNHLMYVEKPLELSAEGHSIRWIDMRRWGIIASRFDFLKDDAYKTERFTFEDSEGNTVRRNKAELFPYVEGEVTTSIRIVDCEDASMNYIPQLHDYLPLPLEEIISNPNLGQ
ncbi:RagB/SusD family nutrient uptake outer membrane protein [Flammeovirga sp. MY04]|uniref:RagB/SusD family nutrient uptake outer membrane protein n=1 Tax=Flammeovirga sp. MY04 TaxID=1191459 RepID=UPI00080629E6|nr:RagB/SusD family nutrient uptake outer membrane protein [Flammeovirga sp. MY04]ANQ51612.1 RagB/SusD family nutrient uptake outer membrane protein [Flammeovirga sp. MY04]